MLVQHTSFSERPKADALVVPFWQTKQGALLAHSHPHADPALERVLALGDFRGKLQELLWIYTSEGKEPRLLLVGMGKQEEFSLESLRRAVGAGIKGCRKRKLTSANVLLPDISRWVVSEEAARDTASPGWAEVVRASVEVAGISNYAFLALFGSTTETDREQPLKTIHLVGEIPTLSSKERTVEIGRGNTLARWTNFARDLVSQNADTVNPTYFAELVSGFAGEHPKLSAQVLQQPALEKANMGLLLAVGKGAAHPPILGIVKYEGAPYSIEHTVLVGKGVTYDTGGLNIKGTGNMETMKCDMAGAATVLAAVRAAAELSLPVNVTAVVPVAENAVDACSYKPGDVYMSHAGLSVEITNTDAEGRLILADALSYVQQHLNPTRLIDLATLTGGVVVALGEEVAGFLSTDDELARELQLSSERTGERIWRLPLVEEYRLSLKSPIADLKNSAGRGASPIMGALFLKQFVQKSIPWAHLDIAGTAYHSEPRSYHTTLATGFGVRLLVDYLARISSFERLGS